MKNNNFKHYFIASEHKNEDFFTFDAEFKNKKYKFKSCDNVFSKDSLDIGSLTLVNTLLTEKENLNGNILDMCCGYGTIGILLSQEIDSCIDMCDINSTAIELTKENIKLNKCKINDVFVSDMYENVIKNYNHIVSNPPIKTGKKLLFSFIDNSFSHLIDSGYLTLVIKKNLGADSLKKYMETVFGNCNILERHKGYYILQSQKTPTTK